jgi:hypothetical protein
VDELLALVGAHGGRVGVVCSHGTWTVGVEWGAEAPDSPMVAGAAYGVAVRLEDAIADVRRQCGMDRGEQNDDTRQ